MNLLTRVSAYRFLKRNTPGAIATQATSNMHSLIPVLSEQITAIMTSLMIVITLDTSFSL